MVAQGVNFSLISPTNLFFLSRFASWSSCPLLCLCLPFFTLFYLCYSFFFFFPSHWSVGHLHLGRLLVHVCNYRALIQSELFPSLRMKRLVIRYALVSICLSLYAWVKTLTLFGRLKHSGLYVPFGCSLPYGYVCWPYLSSASAKHEIFMFSFLPPLHVCIC